MKLRKMDILPRFWVIFVLLAYSTQAFGIGVRLYDGGSKAEVMLDCHGGKHKVIDPTSVQTVNHSTPSCCDDNCHMNACHPISGIPSSFPLVAFQGALGLSDQAILAQPSLTASSPYRPPILC